MKKQEIEKLASERIKNSLAFKYRQFADHGDRDRFDQFMTNDFVYSLIDKKKRYISEKEDSNSTQIINQVYSNQVRKKRDVRHTYTKTNNFQRELANEEDFKTVFGNPTLPDDPDMPQSHRR